MSKTIDMTPDADSKRARHTARSARKRRERRLTLATWSIVIASYVAIVFAFAFPHDFRNAGPAYVWTAWTAFMIRTFSFHLGLFLGAVALRAVLARRWRPVVAILPLVCFCVGSAVWSYMPKPKPPVAGETITVMSINLLGANRNTDAIVAEAVATRPDVLLLQEYRSRWHAAFQPALAADYPHMACAIREDNFGLAVYSRQPLVGAADMWVPLGTAGTPQARAVVLVDDREVAFYNVHLMPPRSLGRTVEQRQEFADLMDRLRREELPIVLCGDFNFSNDTAFADELERLGLVDAHRISGRGRGSTWCRLGPLRWLPGIRLDHVFVSKELTSTASRAGTGSGSDHRPVIADIGFSGG